MPLQPIAFQPIAMQRRAAAMGDRVADDAGKQTLNQIYDSLNVVHRLHEGELAKALNIQLGFNANDGD